MRNFDESVSKNATLIRMILIAGLMLILPLGIITAGAKIHPAPDPSRVHDVQSPEITIRGNITDINSNPLSGVLVRIKGSGKTADISDANGNYTINVPDKYAVIEYICAGFLTLEQTAGDRRTINVIMQEDVGQLEEIVVVGYGTQKKASVVGAIATIAPEKLAAGTTRSISNNLAGRLAGIIGVQRSGEPGYDNSNFWIRGISTFQGGRTPLILVDGIQRSLNNIDTEEIESFSILKDASASAVYGVRGANGVILINTKRGRIGKPSISVKAEHAITQPVQLPQFVGAADYLEVLNSIETEAGRQPLFSDEYLMNTRNRVDPDLYPDVNWIDKILKKTGNNTHVSLDVNGGNEKLRYSFVAAYYHENGILERDRSKGWDSSLRLNRFNLRSNVDINLTSTTLMRVNIGGYLQERISPPISVDDLFYQAYLIPPHTHPAQYSTGEIPMAPNMTNPWAILTQTGYQRSNNNKLESLFAIEQDLKMITPGLKIKGTFSFDAYNYNAVIRSKDPDYYNPATGRDPETGELILVVASYGQLFLDHSTVSDYGNKSTYLEGVVTYDRTFGSGHDVNALFMYNQRHYDDGGTLPYRYQGIAGRASYSFKSRYIAEFNFGYNGSENFAKGNRFGFFPSFAAGWIMSEENFMAPVRGVLSNLKFRASWGLVGNDRFDVRFPYISSINDTEGYVWGYNDAEFARAGRQEGNIANTGLKWETVAKTNFGVEIGLWDAIELQIDIFKEQRRDIFMRRTVMPASAGFVEMPYDNYGKVDNQGVDISLNANRQFSNGFHLSAIATFTYARNKYVEVDEPLAILGTNRARTGHPVDQIFGLIADGLFTDDDFANIDDGILKDGVPLHTFGPVRPGDIKYVDVNGDGRIDAMDESPIGGTFDPQIVYGFGVNMAFHNFDFGIFFQGNALTYKVIGRTGSFIPGSGMGGVGNIFTNVDDRWTVENPRQDVFYPRLYAGLNQNNQQASTWWLRDMSMLRLKNIEIGYSLPLKFIRGAGMKNARIYLRGTNLLTFSKFKLWDPEIDSTEGSRYPLVKSYSIGLNIGF